MAHSLSPRLRRWPWFAVGAALLLASAGSLIAAARNAMRPLIAELVPLTPTVDLGDLAPDATATADIRFRNDAASAASIRFVSTSCGCTLVRQPTERVAPGEVLNLEARFAARGKVGKSGTQIGLLYRLDGETADRRVEVVLWANVIPDFALSQESLSFDERATVRDLSIRKTPTRRVEVVGVQIGHDAFSAEWDEGSQAVRVSFEPLRWDDSTQTAAMLTVETTSPTQPLIHVPLRVCVGAEPSNTKKER